MWRLRGLARPGGCRVPADLRLYLNCVPISVFYSHRPPLEPAHPLSHYSLHRRLLIALRLRGCLGVAKGSRAYSAAADRVTMQDTFTLQWEKVKISW